MKIEWNGSLLNNEMLFVVYLFVFAAIKPVLLISDHSSMILLIATAIIILASLPGTALTYNKDNLGRFAITILLISGLIAFDMLFRPNSIQGTVPYNFLIYGIIPLYLLINVQDFRRVLIYYCCFSIFVACMYLKDPFLGYRWSSNYMQFAFSAMLPGFSGAVLAVCVFKKRICILFMILFAIELLLYGNKSAIISAAILGIMIYYTTTDKNMRSYVLMASILLVVLLVMNFNSILNLIGNMLGKTGAYSYSLTTLFLLFSGNGKTVTSSRLDIWVDAWDIFLKSPIIGHGTVYFEGLSKSESGYAHNLVLDLMVSYGIMALLILIPFIIRTFYRAFKASDFYLRMTLILFITLSLVPMTFSLTFWKTSNFWILVGLVIYRFDTALNHGGEYEEDISANL